MIYFVKITDQGQISIPAEIRKIINEKNLIIDFDMDKKEFTAKPAPNILNYAGRFKSKAFRGKSIDEIVELENKAIAKAASKKYVKNF